jgi:hypothetical protein
MGCAIVLACVLWATGSSIVSSAWHGSRREPFGSVVRATGDGLFVTNPIACRRERTRPWARRRAVEPPT